MTKRKLDWADKRADKFYKELNGDGDLHNWFAGELRKAYRLGVKDTEKDLIPKAVEQFLNGKNVGFKNAVMLLRNQGERVNTMAGDADWLEKQKI